MEELFDCSFVELECLLVVLVTVLLCGLSDQIDGLLKSASGHSAVLSPHNR